MLGWIADDVILAGSVEIWPDHDEILPDLIEISPDLIRSGLDLDEISSDLVGSDGISSNLRQRTPNTAGFCKFSSKILQIIAGGFWFYDRAGWLEFWGRKPATNPKVLGSVGGNSQPTSKWSVWAISGSGSGELLGLVSLTGWVDSPSLKPLT